MNLLNRELSKTNQKARSSGYAKAFYKKYGGSLKTIFNQYL